MRIRDVFSYLINSRKAFSEVQPTSLSLSIRGGNSVETYLFRDKVIENLPDFILDRFPNGSDIICYACSNGHEPYSIAMKMSDTVGRENAKKKYPIKAYDMCEDTIKICQDGKIVLPSNVHDIMREKTSFSFSDAFSEGHPLLDNPIGRRISPAVPNNEISYKVHDVNSPLREMVTFDTGNILENVKNLSFNKPVVFLFRNVWFNFDSAEARFITHHLAKNLPKGSLLVLGDRDQIPKASYGEINTPSISKILESKEFKKVAESRSDDIGRFIYERV